jgi:hypothetical protein
LVPEEFRDFISAEAEKEAIPAQRFYPDTANVPEAPVGEERRCRTRYPPKFPSKLAQTMSQRRR